MNNLRIRLKLTEKNVRYWELGQNILGISEATLCRRLRSELPDDEQNRIIRLIEEYAEKRGGQSK